MLVPEVRRTSRKTAAARALGSRDAGAAACLLQADARIRRKHPASERDDGSAAPAAAPPATYTNRCAQRIVESMEPPWCAPIAQPQPVARQETIPGHPPDQSR